MQERETRREACLQVYEQAEQRHHHDQCKHAAAGRDLVFRRGSVSLSGALHWRVTRNGSSKFGREIIPQARVLNMAVNLGTGSLAFVGGAQGEGQITDSVSGVRMAAFGDKRVGGSALRNAAVWQWGDTEHIMNFWAETLAKRLQQLRSTGKLST